MLVLILQITRENTLLLGIIIVLVAITRKQWIFGLSTILIIALGLSITTYVSSFSKANIHDVNTLIYIILKIPYNLLKNYFGVELWTNTLALGDPIYFSKDPLFKLSIPGWMPLGSIEAIGLYQFKFKQVLSTFTILLTSFGILPSLVLSDFLSRGVTKFNKLPFYIVVSLSFGLISYIIGPMLGASVSRLISYGWPAFWLVFPYLYKNFHSFDKLITIKVFSCHLAVSWLSFLLMKTATQSLSLSIILLCITLLMHGIALNSFKKSRSYPISPIKISESSSTS